MEKKLKEIKHQARNVDKRDLRHVIENLTEAVMEIYKIFNAKQIKPKPVRKSTKAKPKTLKS